jgi:hypothetical protein
MPGFVNKIEIPGRIGHIISLLKKLKKQIDQEGEKIKKTALEPVFCLVKSPIRD